LAEKSDDPLAEAATTAEIAVSQQAASNPQPTFSVNPSDISFSRIALGEAPSSTPAFSPGQIAHETESKLALLNQHLTKLFQQEKVKLAAYCLSDGILLDSSAILFTTWDKHPLTSQTDIFVSPPTPYQQAAPHGSPHLHVDASGNPPAIAFMELFVELLAHSAEPLMAPDDLPVTHKALLSMAAIFDLLQSKRTVALICDAYGHVYALVPQATPAKPSLIRPIFFMIASPKFPRGTDPRMGKVGHPADLPCTSYATTLVFLAPSTHTASFKPVSELMVSDDIIFVHDKHESFSELMVSDDLIDLF
jgi:hypothetical protein